MLSYQGDLLAKRLFESVTSCMVNIESVYVVEQCAILFHVQKHI